VGKRILCVAELPNLSSHATHHHNNSNHHPTQLHIDAPNTWRAWPKTATREGGPRFTRPLTVSQALHATSSSGATSSSVSAPGGSSSGRLVTSLGSGPRAHSVSPFTSTSSSVVASLPASVSMVLPSVTKENPVTSGFWGPSKGPTTHHAQMQLPTACPTPGHVCVSPHRLLPTLLPDTLLPPESIHPAHAPTPTQQPDNRDTH
jgi:hypothetical protein